MPEHHAISITPAAPRSIAGIGAFRDQDRVREALRAEFGVAVIPARPGFVEAGPTRLACLAPARFLASGERDADLPARLASALDGLAAITDQSDVWVTTLLSGPHIQEILARVVPIDLSADKFGVGDLALTRAGHLDVRLWCIGHDTYEIAVARSYALDLRHTLESASHHA